MKKKRLIKAGTSALAYQKLKKIMKLNVLFLFVFCFNLSASVFSQHMKVSLKLEKASMEEFFQVIQDKTGLSFLYNSKLFGNEEKITLDIVDKPLNEILTEVLEPKGFTYKYRDEVIVVKKIPIHAQQEKEKRSITGIVKDDTGAPLPGATVLIKGTLTGVVTDVNGNFSLSTEDVPNITIVISFVGMKTREIVVDGNKPLEIVLLPNTEELGQVVITGYYQLSQERSAGSFSVVKGEELSLKSDPSIIGRLNGLIPGFVVNPSGTDKYLLRGATSINSSREPLFVVDGMPMELNTLEATVNPEDVLNVSVLKDATASSIWGARAANGVIVITTKRGRLQEKTRISYTGSLQLQGLPDFDYLDYMRARDYVDFAVSVFDPVKTNYGTNVLGRYGIITPVERILYKGETGEYSATEVERELDKLRNSDNRKQIEDYLYRWKTVHQHNISLYGGSDKAAYFLSVNYRNTKPQQKTVNEDRLIIDTKNDFNLTSWLKLSVGANISYMNKKYKYLPDAVGMIPYERLKDADGNPTSQMHMFYSDEAVAWTGQELDKRNMMHYDYVLLNELDLQKNKESVFNARIQGKLDIKLYDGLTFESQFQYQNGYGKVEKLDKAESFKVRNLIAQQTPLTAGSVSRVPVGAIQDKTWSNTIEWIVRNQISYDLSIRDEHNITVLAGTEIRKNIHEIDNRIVYGYNENTKQHISLNEQQMIAGVTGGTIVDPNSQTTSRQSFTNGFGTGYVKYDKRFFSLYANGAYDYKSKYGLNASIRVDQANLFGTDIRYKPIWSVGVLWNLHHEDFWNRDLFDRFTFRISRGIAGNTPNSEVGGPYDIIRSAGYGNFSFGQTQSSMNIISPALKNLKWEKTTITNLGIDFSTLQNRLSGSVDFYRKNTNDLIGQQTIDPTGGFATISTNIGKMRNTGIEIMLSSINIAKNDFKWSSSFNFAYNRNKVVDIYVEPNITQYISTYQPVFIQGYEAYSIFSYKWAGLNEIGEPTVYDENGQATDKAISDINALVHSGTAQPPFTGSLSNTFSYKNLTLSIQIIYNLGHKMRDDVPGTNISGRLLYSQALNGDIWKNPIHKDMKHAWRKAGDDTNVPRWLPVGESRHVREYYPAADINIINASYIYINDITLSYNLPSSIVSPLKLKQCMLSVQVSNPYCWKANKEGVDPRFVGSMIGGQRTLKYGPEYMLKLNVHF